MSASIESSGYFSSVNYAGGSGGEQTSAFVVGSGGRRIVVCVGAPNGVGTPSVTGVTDTIGNSYSRSSAYQDNLNEVAEIWTAWSTGSNANNVVTVTTAAESPGLVITAYSVPGSGSSGIGAYSVGAGGSNPAANAITPQAAGSMIFFCGCDYDSGTARTAASGCTIDHEADDTSNDAEWTGHLTSPTAGTSQITVGTSAPTTGDWAAVALEILAVASGAELDGSGTSTSSGAGALTTQILLAGSGASSSSGSAELTTGSDISGSGVSASSGTGALTTQIKLAGSGTSTCSGSGTLTTASPYTTNAVDPIAQPPNNTNAPGIESAARPLFICDNTPGKAGDIFGLFVTYESVTYLLVSADRGASYTYISTSGTAPAAGSVNDMAIAQDTSANKVHFVTFNHSASNALYHRGVLSYDGSGHITGFTWEAVDQVGPAFDGSAASNHYFSCALGLNEVIDGNGAHILILGGVDRPTNNRVSRLVAAKSTSLTPTGQSSWTKLDGNSGYTVLCANNVDTGVDPNALLNRINQPSDMSIHEVDFTFAQLPSDKSLHFFFGGMFYDDRRKDGDILRWRFTASGATFALSANGTTVAPANSTASPQIGNSFSTPNFVWFVYGDVLGIRICAIDNSGAWYEDVFGSSPDDSANCWYYAALSIDPTETYAWIQWERWPQEGSFVELSAYWNSSKWIVHDDTALWSQAGWDGAGVWCPIKLPNGVGAVAYRNSDWAQETQHWRAHVIYTAGAELAGSGASTCIGTGALTTQIRCTGSAASSSSGAGALTTQIRLVGSGASSSSGSADLTTGEELTGSGSSTSSGAGELTTQIRCTGSGASSSSGTGALTTQIRLTGAGTSSSIGTGDLTSGASLTGSGSSACSGSADLTTQILLTGSGASSSSGAADLLTGNGFSGFGQSICSGSCELTTHILMTGAGISTSFGIANFEGTMDYVRPLTRVVRYRSYWRDA